MSRGELNDMGPTAVLQVAGIDIVVISNHVEPNDMAAMTAVGIAPDRLRYVMLKSRIHWRAGLRPMSYATVECAGTGVCSSDYDLLGLHKVRRPIYPINAL
jgi:microcystin degradation protein MlrC